MGTDSETQQQIYALVRTIQHLLKNSNRDWVSWRKVAKEQEGSEELAEILSALSETHEAKDYFVISPSRKHVKLSEKGLSFVPDLIFPPSQIQRVAGAVKHYAGKLSPQYLKVDEILSVGRTEKHYIHTIHIEVGDLIFPTETPVTFFSEQGGSSTRGRIVGQEPDGQIIYIAFESKILNYQLPGKLKIDRAFLIYQLANSIENLKEIPNLGHILMNKNTTRDAGIFISDPDPLKVVDDLYSLKTPWSRFLWGPPGAGKTFAIARLIKRILESDPTEKILLIAPSNLAVDVAVEQFLDQLQDSELKRVLQDRRILRYGYPRKPEIIVHPELLGPESQNVITKELKTISTQLMNMVSNGGLEADLAILRARLLELQEELKKLIVEHIQQSVVVATSVTLAYLPSSPINKIKWDTVIIDEVTMVPPAVCLYLSALAKKRLLLVGDPQQLGPVYEDNNKDGETADYDWMGRDVFDLCGITQHKGGVREILIRDTRLTRITSQRRCPENLWSKVKQLYPEVQNLSAEDATNPICLCHPNPGQNFVVFDVSSDPEASCELVRKSWQNRVTAKFALQIAEYATSQFINSSNGQTPKIAIITPYRAQVRLLKQLLKDSDSVHSSKTIQVGTIHQFQGSEADLVVFDLVDGPGRNKLGNLLRNDTGMRLINVATTRARQKFVIILNKHWLKSTNRSDNTLLWDLVSTSKEEEWVDIEGWLTKEQELFEIEEPATIADETMTLSLGDITYEFILSRGVGQTIVFTTKKAKNLAKDLIKSNGYQIQYFPEGHYTICKKDEISYRIDHSQKRLTRIQ